MFYNFVFIKILNNISYNLMFRLLEQLYAIPNQKAIFSKLKEFLSSKFIATGES